MLTEKFEMAAGSIVGHLHLGQNGLLWGQSNQDALAIYQDSSCMIMVVCDGCGSSDFAQLGSRLGADLIVASLQAQLARGICWGDPSEHAQVAARLWERVNMDVLAQLRVIALMGAGSSSLSEYVSSRLLFTVVATLVTPTVTSIAAVGDGYVIVNGKIEKLGPFEENKPPYFAYGGLVESNVKGHREQSRLQVRQVLPTEELQTLLLATDGLEDLIAASDKKVPVASDKLGGVEQFWKNDQFFKNGDAIRRRLALANSEQVRIDRASGDLIRHRPLLKDDTTVTVLRRRW